MVSLHFKTPKCSAIILFCKLQICSCFSIFFSASRFPSWTGKIYSWIMTSTFHSSWLFISLFLPRGLKVAQDWLFSIFCGWKTLTYAARVLRQKNICLISFPIYIKATLQLIPINIKLDYEISGDKSHRFKFRNTRFSLCLKYEN